MKQELIEDILLLYVEDEEETRHSLERFLKRRIKHIITASNGQEGLELYKKHKPNLIITDVKMPVLSGLEMSSMIRDEDENTPIIVISAHSDTSYFQEAINIGINSFLLKPVDLSQLYCTVKIMTDNILLKRENRINEKLIHKKNFQLEDKNIELQKTIENLTQTQDKLVEYNKMANLGELVAGVTHEINTPLGVGLTSITYFLQLTKDIQKHYEDKDMSEEEFKEYIHTSKELASMIYLNLERTSNIIKSFKQVAIDQTNEEKREFNLKDYLEKVVFSLYYMTKKTNINIKIDCDENINLNSYAGLYSQIITNLIQNSLVHAYDTKQKGQIKIEACKKNNKLFLRYKDDGKGMSEDEIENIYRPFYTTKKNDGGTGLGMSIIFNIVKQDLKGEISCKSKVGKGTTFDIEVPL